MGRKGGVGVKKEQELKLEEIEAPHTLGVRVSRTQRHLAEKHEFTASYSSSFRPYTLVV